MTAALMECETIDADQIADTSWPAVRCDTIKHSTRPEVVVVTHRQALRCPPMAQTAKGVRRMGIARRLLQAASDTP